MGQKQQIEALRQPPASSEDCQSLIEALRNTVGRIMCLRQAFRDSFEAMSQPNAPGALHELLTDKQREDMAQLRRLGLHTCSLSDTLVAFAPLAAAGSLPSMHGIFAVLHACAHVILAGMAYDLAIRGGVEVGWAVEFTDPAHKRCGVGEIYGAPLSDADTLESEVARWPRIVVGTELVKMLEANAKANASDTHGVCNREWAKACRELVFRDVDGAHALDYLGKAVAEMQERQATPSDLRQVAAAVLRGRERVVENHKRSCDEGQHKVALGYAVLRDYYESRLRLPVWQRIMGSSTP